jgi:flagellar protein FlgJ
MIGAAVTDFSNYAALRAEARHGEGEDRAANLDAVARQFESLFIHMVVKQMRQTSLGDGLFDSQQSQTYRDMYDQQISSHMADSGGLGLAPVIKRQLGGAVSTPERGRSQADYLAAPTPRAPALDPAVPAREPGFAGPADFVRRLRPHAERAAAELGVPTEALLAQAALETGWGKAVMQRPEGGISHNLFGIKADRRWEGEQVKVSTLEYRDGLAMKTRAAFRAYDSYADSFADYAAFIAGNPRYREALQSAADPKAYFEKLQQAGYATDPNYARKVLDILQRPELRAAADAAPRPAEA